MNFNFFFSRNHALPLVHYMCLLCISASVDRPIKKFHISVMAVIIWAILWANFPADSYFLWTTFSHKLAAIWFAFYVCSHIWQFIRIKKAIENGSFFFLFSLKPTAALKVLIFYFFSKNHFFYRQTILKGQKQARY